MLDSRYDKNSETYRKLMCPELVLMPYIYYLISSYYSLRGAHAGPYIQVESARKKVSEQHPVILDRIKTIDQFENDLFYLGFPSFPKTKQNCRKGYL